MASKRKTFFLVRDFDLPPDGPLQLGSILSNATDCRSILNRDDRVVDQEPDQRTSHVLRDFKSSSNDPAFGPWQKSMRGILGVNASTKETTEFSCEELLTVSFSPKDDYIRQSVEKRSVQAYLRRSILSSPVYMVTGLKIARGAKFSQSQSGAFGHGVEASIGVAIPGVPVEVQASTTRLGPVAGSKAGQQILSGGSTDCIFAYSVRKITQSRRSYGKQVRTQGADWHHQSNLEESFRSNIVSKEDDNAFEPVPIVAEEDETAPDETQPVRILCLDGGGVRGISSLCMLKELMLEVGVEKQRQSVLNGGSAKEPECCRPCDYFDLICGTSTGGLIALMLGRMQYTVDQAIEKYSELAEDVFTSKSRDPKAKYDHRILEKKIKYVIEKASPPLDTEAMLEDSNDREGRCKVFVVTTLQNHGSTPYLMRTYETNSGQPGPGPFPAKIWEAARATSAAPTFFLPIDIKIGLGTRETPFSTMTFGDGGTTANNPSFEALLEYQSLWPWRPLGCLVSLGTGVEEDARIEEDRRWTIWMLRKLAPGTAFLADVAKYCAQVTTSCEKIHDNMERVMQGVQWKERYFRLNVKYEGKKKIELDEFKRIGEMREESEKYMRNPGPKGAKEKIGVILVNPESERNRKLDEDWGLHGLVVPEVESGTVDSPASTDIDRYAVPASRGPSNSDTETSAETDQAVSARNTDESHEAPAIAAPIDLTWLQHSNKLSAIQSVIFYHYDDFGNGWDLTKQPRNGDSVLFDRRDQGESAVAVLELSSKASFVSTSFVKRFKIKPEKVPAVHCNSLRIGMHQVQPDLYINLTFRCRGFNMPKQRHSFYVLQSNDFEIMFGEDVLKRNQLANQANAHDQEGQFGKPTGMSKLRDKARPLIGRRESENLDGSGRERGNIDGKTYASDFHNGALF